MKTLYELNDLFDEFLEGKRETKRLVTASDFASEISDFWYTELSNLLAFCSPEEFEGFEPGDTGTLYGLIDWSDDESMVALIACDGYVVSRTELQGKVDLDLFYQIVIEIANYCDFGNHSLLKDSANHKICEWNLMKRAEL